MFKPTRALPLMIFAGITLSAAILELFSSGQIYVFLKSPEVTEQWLEKALAFWTPVSETTLAVQSTVNPMMMIAIVIWLRRAVVNAGALDTENFKTKPSSAIWGSLVPFLNFFYPFVLIRKVWLAADSSKKGLATLLVVGLWFSYMTELFARWLWFAISTSYSSGAAFDRNKLALVYTGDYFTQTCALVAGALTLIIVSKLNRVQHRKALVAGLTTVPLKADLVTLFGLVSNVLAQIVWPFIGLAGVIMIYSFVWKQFGLLGSIGAVLFVPFTVTLIPWYAAFAKQDWSLVFISYAAGLLLMLMRAGGNWLSDLSDEPVAMVTNIDANKNSDQKADLV
ncbi:MAG: DUF4328 domain-containing protein [Candidatus Obscuribacterales bacterium]